MGGCEELGGREGERALEGLAKRCSSKGVRNSGVQVHSRVTVYRSVLYRPDMMPAIPALSKPRQEDCYEFEAGMGT